MADLVSRYRAGEYVEVWKELRAQGDLSDSDRVEALRVADETMARVRKNVEILTSRLEEYGWQALCGKLHTMPAAGDLQVTKAIQNVSKSPIPPSLDSFWRIVGGVDLVWDYNIEPEDDEDESTNGSVFGLGRDFLANQDPLSVSCASDCEYLLDEWDDPEREGAYLVQLAPDDLHKVDTSGGPAYGIELPSLSADPVFANERHALQFTDYLRFCFRWGGFPGLEAMKNKPEVQAFLTRMREGLVPF